ncbi:hypothetical protein JCM19046_2919 [Bacillus sp. JCM 19046]|uniref:Small multi-drug export protein n=1 Tax=Shouchella xiaoxiensis TaxID=766895 RepID=A0ABS2SNW0_9BACI|nr:hypothetical protein [Shouchella xiaoxiensis]MBM7837214.1 hypothetical protein [Shouchella xiaoxiensis]GAF11396.1 hypothetical protein JCM19045_494 [Bacillus sp. JCM 19045]GAF18348.1 hypothetical protein JCM19046_2919 [Bacillus sp. JCM 19046]
MDFIHYFVVFLLSFCPFAELFIGIPIGIVVFELEPHLVAPIGFLGNALSIILVQYLIIRFHDSRLLRPITNVNPANRAVKFIHLVIEKCGLFVATLLIPFMISGHVGIAMHAILGVSKQKLLNYLLVSLAIWSFLLIYLSKLIPQFLL